MLSLLFCIPFFGSLCVILTSNAQKMKIIAFNTSLISFIIALILWIQFDENSHEFQFVHEFHHVSIGVDSISLSFIILTTFITVISILISWYSIPDTQIKNFLILLLILESLLIAVFIVLDLLYFYITFEATLIPMTMIIGIWGSKNKKIKAVFYFFLYTLLGSLFMLFSILYILSITGTTDLQSLYLIQLSTASQFLIWIGFFLAFSVKLPLIPLHIWLPIAHSNAPLAGSIILASILLKLAVYGVIRVLLPILPDATIYFTPLVFTLALISIIYSSLATLRQIDTKAIIAYSSVGHMSVILLGLFSNTIQGIEGAIFLSIAHGIVSPALFILVTILYQNHGTRIITYFSGMAQNMPIFAIFFFIFTIANCATPLTANFIGEFLSLVGSFQANPVITALAGISMILSAAYSFWLFNRIAFGTESPYLSNVRDVTRLEFMVLLPLAFLTILFGVFPNIILDTIHFTVSTLIIDTYINSPPAGILFALIPFISLTPKVRVNMVIIGYNVNGRICFSTEHNNANEESSFIYDDISASRDQIREDLKGKAGVYQFLHKDDPTKMYIGSSNNLWERIRYHLKTANNQNYLHVSLLYRAIGKYGWNKFKLIILEFTDSSKENILVREQYYLDLYRPYYNILTEAGSSLGIKLSEETKYKMSMAKGSTVYVYSSDCSTFIDTFSSARKVAEFFSINHSTVIKYAQNGCVYNNKWVFSFILLEPGFQPLKQSNKKTGPKGFTIYVYSSDRKILINTFSSISEAAESFNCYKYTISKFAKSKALFKKLYILSLTPLSNSQLGGED